MTQTFGLNSLNDIYLGTDGNIVVLSGIQAIAGACETVSKSQLGEMVLTTTQGLPNFQAVWQGVPNLRLWQSYLLKALQNVSGVLEVSNLSLEKVDGILTYQATIKTPFGTTQISG